jgi:hypothetical protein
VQPLLSRKSNKYYTFRVSVCSLTCPPGNAHALYCHLRPVWFFSIFFTSYHKRHDLQRNVIGHKMYAFIFSTTFVSHYKKNLARYNHKCKMIFKLNNYYYCQILMKIEFSRKIFKNKQTSNFTKIRQVGAELLHADRRMNRQTDTTKLTLFVIFRMHL